MYLLSDSYNPTPLFTRVWNDKGPYRENIKEISAQDIWIENSGKVTYKHAYKLNIHIKHKYSAYNIC